MGICADGNLRQGILGIQRGTCWLLHPALLLIFFPFWPGGKSILYPAFLPPQWKNILQWPLFIISLFFLMFCSKIFCLVLDSRRVMYCLTSDLFFISWSLWIYHWLNVSSFSSVPGHWSLESLELSLWSFSSKYWVGQKVHLGFSINLYRMNELFH